MDASEIHARRLNAKVVLVPKNGDEFVFPCADGAVKLAGKDHEVRASIPVRIQFGKGGEDHRDELQGEAGGLDSAVQRELDGGEARDVFWSISGDHVYRHHVQERMRLNVLEEDSFSIPLHYIDVTRRTNTTLDVLLESRIDDYWDVDGDWELSAP